MNEQLRATLRSFLQDGDVVAGRNEKTPEDVQKQRLQRKLAELRRSNHPFFVAYLAAIVVLFLGSIGLTIWVLRTPEKAALTLGATGASIAFMVQRVATLWKDKWIFDLLFAGIEEFTAAELKAVVVVLVGKM